MKKASEAENVLSGLSQTNKRLNEEKNRSMAVFRDKVSTLEEDRKKAIQMKRDAQDQLYNLQSIKEQ